MIMDIQALYQVLKPPVLIFSILPLDLENQCIRKRACFASLYPTEPVQWYDSTIQRTENCAIVFSGPGFLFKKFGFGSYLKFFILL